MPTTLAPDVPYSIALGDGSRLAIALPAEWTKLDRDGTTLLLPHAIRMIDRLRALFAAASHPTPGSIVSLREALAQSPNEFSESLGHSPVMLAELEQGTRSATEIEADAIRRLATAAARVGVRVDGSNMAG